ncbi:hypothetical protein ACFPT7_16180 [Acidicapsa dinghuensis]|uniref:DUF2946 domain-containing protein n=1 Tax=Acidicapsa dinghuensis TaxID=2218256 RepID=A0ABW1EKP7_9BACT|nr:hypothetical protein [Acidicapsa dinghuensis]
MKQSTQQQKQAFTGRSASLRRVTTIACLLLLTLLAFVQVAHVHPTAADADHCPICVVMHSAAPVAAVAAAIIVVHASEPLVVQEMASVVRPWHCTLFNRPPPQARQL